MIHDAGKVPTITPPAGREQARINAAEFQQARAAVLAQLDPLLARRRAGIYLDAADFQRMRQLQAANRKAHELRDHRARMRTLRAVLPVQAFHTAPTVQHPVADASLSLTREASRSHPTQTSLF